MRPTTRVTFSLHLCLATLRLSPHDAVFPVLESCVVWLAVLHAGMHHCRVVSPALCDAVASRVETRASFLRFSSSETRGKDL